MQCGLMPFGGYKVFYWIHCQRKGRKDLFLFVVGLLASLQTHAHPEPQNVTLFRNGSL